MSSLSTVQSTVLMILTGVSVIVIMEASNMSYDKYVRDHRILLKDITMALQVLHCLETRLHKAAITDHSRQAHLETLKDYTDHIQQLRAGASALQARLKLVCPTEGYYNWGRNLKLAVDRPEFDKLQHQVIQHGQRISLISTWLDEQIKSEAT